jgi:diguanylate cyclase
VSPEIFIPLAEESDLIVGLSESILRAACQEAATWREPRKVAVNISPRHFQQVDLPQPLHQVLLETGLPA